ncbi:MAG TPA: guanitoxin biosynthesis heme-dependent pre-guanitoxin N-hydroxylase GntA [Intrasporangium sp.]|uniref:guanitoxin biosynthesis heme-dependent pre-guanitoxin N-hydroxylase GntA n=1 Tax=Intrasporangium sp. TaxID=1925024 RepID=UPI002D79269E|nr:guanitoxin biosynthesis heme-dependent pre-guanitoxin N-hydroxylase GntA [Intrasporangium sp.]HET7398618.1 guanitoxin biosynthesis heme-dependent pre-guanitoxin N-hydroxylase GntA [Intrasporangium sp.]
MPDLAPDVPDPASAPDRALVESMSAMVGHPDYPCLGARSVYRRDRATVRVYDELAGAGTAPRLLEDLRGFAADVDLPEGFASFVAIFRGPRVVGEQHFEELLWAQLRSLHAEDGAPWSPDVSADPRDKHFALSLGGTAYFVVGLHPAASRDARRAAAPTLVFNFHDQFTALRASGGYPRMRDRIRERDQRLQGTINPMVADHGTASEARQYSGRAVGPDWQPPFEQKKVRA